jgi:PAS domain S-box-containing protein
VTTRLRRAGSRKGVPAGSRLALAEFLVQSDNPHECARRVLDWLAAHLPLRRGLCVAVEGVPGRLLALAGHGVREPELAGWSVPLEETEHPLVVALGKGEPRVVPLDLGRGARRRVAAERDLFLALPLLAGGDTASGAGLLLLSPPAAAAAPDARWAASVLGPKLLRHRSFHALRDAERRLERERGLLATVINAVPDPVLLTDPEGRIVVANTRAETLFASGERESEGRRRAIALNNMFFSAALGRRAIGDVESLRRELLLVDPADGSDLFFEVLSTVVSDAREGTGIVSILRNVTDLRRAIEEIEENYRKLRVAEAETRAERDRLNLVIDSVADPIVVTDPNGATVLMNAPAERLFTTPPAAGAERLQRVRTNDATLSSFLSNVFLTGREERSRGRFQLVAPASGAALPFEAIAGKVINEHGELTAIVTILHDRTEALEREHLYEQLKRASAELEGKVREATAELVWQNELLQRQALELEQASALKSQFLANMSHEFRTPLNAMLGYTNMLLQGVYGELPAQQRRNLTRVDSNARHLLTIIENILDISKIEAGQMAVHPSEFALPDLIGEVTAELEPLIARSTLTVTHRVAEDLPTLLSDRGKVKQIVLNLLTNALKFTPAGSVTIRPAWDPARGEVAIAVVDTGIGIADAERERIFEDFRQADSSPTRAYGGTGLGLAISRRLATTLGGRITVDSAVGRGSTFTLVLPLRVPGAR